MKTFRKICCIVMMMLTLFPLCSCEIFFSNRGKLPVLPEVSPDSVYTTLPDAQAIDKPSESNTLGAYKKAFLHLWDNDKSLNNDISVVGVDISGIKNLSDSEKCGFLQYISEQCGHETIEGTFDELAEKGLIDKENLRFEKGVFISFSTNEIDDDGFEFAMKKWRSGKGAIFFDDVEVEFEAGFTQIDFGGMAIA